MSKKVKQLEMDSLKKTFQAVRDLVVLSGSGVHCQQDNQLRLVLRKKNIRLQLVKNSLARRVFQDMGIQLSKVWEGPTLMAWGTDSLAELSKGLDEVVKKNPKLTVKTAVAEGQEVTFAQALKMPTRLEALGQILAMLLGPAAQLAGQLAGPAAQLAGQIQTLSEKKPAAAPAG